MNTLTGYSKNILSDLYALTASGGHFSIHNGRNNEADKLVRTDSNGYLNTGWINTTSGSFSGTPSRIYASNDAYIRYMTPANFFPTLANSDNLLSITVGGLNRKLTVDYANSAGTLQRVSGGFTVSSAGWYKLAKYANSDSRGSIRLALVTTGGNYTPRYTEVKFSEGWSSIVINQNGKFDWISKYRYTTDGSSCYIEAYFNSACTFTLYKLSNVAYVDDVHVNWSLYSTATQGSGTVIGTFDADTNSTLYSNGTIASLGGFNKIGYDDTYVLLAGGGLAKITNLNVGYANSAGSVAWSNISGKPSSFPPSSHTHSYLPLAGGTLSGHLSSNSGYTIVQPYGAQYNTTTSSVTGCITVVLPASIGNSMVSMWIDVYVYSTQQSFSVHCGGYTYNNSTWSNQPFAMVYGADHRVRMGHNGTNFVIYIGEVSTVWSYPQVSVRNVTLGYSPTIENWQKTWGVVFSTSVSNVTYDTTTYAWTTKNLTKSSIGLGNVQNTAFYKRYLNINGTNYAFASTTNSSTSTTIYAPTSAGTSGQVLTSSGGTPSWTNQSSLSVGYANSSGYATSASTLQRISGGFTVSSAGWYKLAKYESSDSRGSIRLALVTTGGNYTPRYTEVKFSEGWSSIVINQNGKFDWISKYRYTTDGSNCYIEAYFTSACTFTLYKLSNIAYVDDVGVNWTLYTTPTQGSGTVLGTYDAATNSTLYSNGTIAGLGGFNKIGYDDTYVLLAGGGLAKITNLNVGSAGYASSAGNADTVDNKHALDFLQYITQNATFSSVANISTDLTPGIHKIHISGVEYSSILTGKDFNGSYWQMYFHPTSGYTQDIKYRATNCTTWKTLLDSNNYTSYTVKKDGTGATGTWGINVTGSSGSCTGNAASATKLGSSNVGTSDRPIYLSSGSPTQTTYRMVGTNTIATSAVAIDSATNTGIWYVNDTSSILSQSDGVAIVNKYNEGWITQIYQDYRTGKIAVRGKNNGTWQTWKTVAYITDIPTNISQLTNDSGFVTRNINTSTNTNPFIVSRSGGTVEALKIGVDDNSVYFVHEQDETVSDFIFKGKWNDTESGGGNSAGEKTIRFGLSSSDHNIYVGSSKVLHAGNYTSYLGYIGTTSVQSSSAAQALTGISRINNSTSANIYLGNSGNQGWVMTLDICSHSGSNYWAISVAGNAWFKKVNIGYAYGTNGSNLLNVTGGLIDVTNNNNTLSIGSRNATWCHFENSADIAFYFNNTIHSTGGFTVYSTSYGINSSGVGTFSNVKPVSNNTYTLGTSSLKWKNVYATTFNGNLSGNATTATNADTVDTYHISVGSSAGTDSNTIYFVI